MRRALRLQTAWRACCAATVLAASACSDQAAPASPSATSALVVSSSVMSNGGQLPAEFTCDGAGVSPPLAWAGAPADTAEFAVLMSTLPGDGTTKWNWVLYAVPPGVGELPRAVSGVGVFGVGSDGPQAAYQPPCSQGPGAKEYTFTVYALSRRLTQGATPATGLSIQSQAASAALATGTLRVTYTRPRT